MEEMPEKSNLFVLNSICSSIDNSTNYDYNTLLDDCSTEIELKNFLLNTNSLTTLNHNSNLNYSEFNNSTNNESNNKKNFSMENLNNSNEIMCLSKNDVFFSNNLIQKSFCSFNPINNNSNSLNQDEINFQPLDNPTNTFYSKNSKPSLDENIKNDKILSKPNFSDQNEILLINNTKTEDIKKLPNKEVTICKINKNVIVNQNSRQSHNEKERKRRSRMKKSCEMLRNLVPGITEKTDKATVLECTVQYLIKLQKCLDSK